ncbi:hypothetical protein [Mycobacterium uberis]|uniref:hypothetical protein n=1 Tax=Mycobacterium uberis TaxID=2162698 RepID=UPI0010587AD1|nr:hypothetical protein [Mycobacterium uberis]
MSLQPNGHLNLRYRNIPHPTGVCLLTAAVVVALVAICSHVSKILSAGPVTVTTVRHLVVIFPHEKGSFDDSFGTDPMPLALMANYSLLNRTPRGNVRFVDA